jgi:hypothetical protein
VSGAPAVAVADCALAAATLSAVALERGVVETPACLAAAACAAAMVAAGTGPVGGRGEETGLVGDGILDGDAAAPVRLTGGTVVGDLASVLADGARASKGICDGLPTDDGATATD